MRRARLAPVVAIAAVLLPLPAAAQVGDPLIQIFEPFEWSEETPRALDVPVGTLIRIRGQAYHPNGIRTLRVAGTEVTERERDATGAELFSAAITVTAGLTDVLVTIEPVSGARFERRLPLSVRGAAPPATPPPAAARAEASPRFSPNGALVRGLLVPGLGHFYTQRPGRGIAYLVAAGAAAGAGIALSSEATLECNEFDECNEVESESDLVIPGLVAAAVVAVIGAIDARSYAARSGSAPGDDADAGASAAAGLRFELPTVGVARRSVRLTLLRARF